MYQWIIGIIALSATLAIGCGDNSLPPDVDAAIQADLERARSIAGGHERVTAISVVEHARVQAVRDARRAERIAECVVSNIREECVRDNPRIVRVRVFHEERWYYVSDSR